MFCERFYLKYTYPLHQQTVNIQNREVPTIVFSSASFFAIQQTNSATHKFLPPFLYQSVPFIKTDLWTFTNFSPIQELSSKAQNRHHHNMLYICIVWTTPLVYLSIIIAHACPILSCLAMNKNKTAPLSSSTAINEHQQKFYSSSPSSHSNSDYLNYDVVSDVSLY